MTRRTLLLSLVGFGAAPAQAKGLHVVGTLGGPDTEGGYFELQTPEGKSGRELIVMTPIRSPLYPILKGLIGTQVQVSIFTP